VTKGGEELGGAGGAGGREMYEPLAGAQGRIRTQEP
jgi:hypothetical protein